MLNGAELRLYLQVLEVRPSESVRLHSELEVNRDHDLRSRKEMKLNFSEGISSAMAVRLKRVNYTT